MIADVIIHFFVRLEWCKGKPDIVEKQERSNKNNPRQRMTSLCEEPSQRWAMQNKYNFR